MNNSDVVSKRTSIVWVKVDNIDERIDGEYYDANNQSFIQTLNSSPLKKVKFKDVIKKMTDMYSNGAFELSNRIEFCENGINFIRVNNVENQIIDIDKKTMQFITSESNELLKKSSGKEGNVLVTKTGRVGSSAVITKSVLPLNVSGDIANIELVNGVIAEYISIFIESKYGKSQINRFFSGSSRPRIIATNLKEIKIPLPSLKIQKYIGDKVRKAEESREEAKRLKKEAENILYKELKKEEFLEKQKTIINKFMWLNNKDIETRIDSGYYKPNYILYKRLLKKNRIVTLKIEDIVKVIKTGTTPENKFITQEEKNIKFLRVNNLGYCFLNEDDLLYVDNNYEEIKLRFLQQEDILVSIAGTLGRSAVVDTNNCITNQNIAALTLKNTKEIRPYYLSLYFNSYFGNLSLDTISTQAIIKYINNQLLGGIEIPVIRIEIQVLIENKIIEYKNKLNNSKQLIQEAKQDIEDLIEGNFDMSKIKEPAF